MRHNLTLLGATTLFIDGMLPALWDAALAYGIDPVGAVAQAAKETGYGSFPGRVRDWFFNTAGIKVRDPDAVKALIPSTDGDHPLCHAQFAGWSVGAVAQAQHLRAYCNVAVTDLVVDPRYVWVIGHHACVTWADLGGRWAPSPTYGEEIWALAQELATPL